MNVFLSSLFLLFLFTGFIAYSSIFFLSSFFLIFLDGRRSGFVLVCNLGLGQPGRKIILRFVGSVQEALTDTAQELLHRASIDSGPVALGRMGVVGITSRRAEGKKDFVL